MAFEDLEREGGKPVEVYRFTYGAEEWLWTSGDTSIVIDSARFVPQALTRGRIEMNDEARTGTVDIKAPASNEVVRLFARSQPSTPVTVEIFRVQLDDETLTPVTIFSGQVEYCKFSPRTGLLHCAPVESLAQRKLAILSYQTTCNNALFDNRCGVVRATFTFSHDVIDMPEPAPLLGFIRPRIQLDAAAAAYFIDPLDQLLKGGVAQLGEQRQTIIDHAGDMIYLIAPLDGLEIGDTLTLSAGCDKAVATCRDTFDNLVRFNGFPAIPQQNPFDGAGGLE